LLATLIENPEGATPLSPDDMLSLKHKHVDTREQLNELEAANILQGQMWASKHKNPTAEKIFNRDFVTQLHKALFGDVWQWTGIFRQRGLNIGVDQKNIAVDLHNFLEDAKCWVEFKHYDNLELSARIQHRLVQIHPFVNGNGRHSRIFTDIVRVYLLGEKPMKWANANLENMTEERSSYISSLRESDAGDLSAFIAYLRSLGN
jgi:Fic-DOC domain mobile mystery protein B